jgi:aminoglycoside phosphotransferase family enzyme/predicted kinase
MKRSTPRAAELVETHISVITMIGERAYKLMKPVSMAFLDHRLREDRLAACRRETILNRRFAPDVYLGVLDVVDEDGVAQDHLVAMRRMPAERRLAGLLDTPEAPEVVREVARTVAGFHREAPTSRRIEEAGRLQAVRALWDEGLDQLEALRPRVVPQVELERARGLATAYISGRRALFERRIACGRVRDGHGDLLADDVFCLGDGPRILDCLAFDDRFRHGDVLADIAFLAMDLEAHGHPALGDLLIAEWREALGEDHPASLAHLYVAYRAHVRSKIAALRSVQGDAGAPARSRALHRLSLSHLERAQVRVVLVGGLPGTGKSTLANGLGAATGWVVLRSDAIRKDLAGLPHTPVDPGAFEAGLYAPEVSDRVYATMLERAAAHLSLGEGVVLDASWSTEARRDAARRMARSAGADVIELACRLDPAVAAARIAERRAAGEGPSDATAQVAARMAAGAEPWPAARPLDATASPDTLLDEALGLVGPFSAQAGSGRIAMAPQGHSCTQMPQPLQ